jgi:hypothetical protein
MDGKERLNICLNCGLRRKLFKGYGFNAGYFSGNRRRRDVMLAYS